MELTWVLMVERLMKSFSPISRSVRWVTNWSRTRHAYPRDVVRGFLNCEGIQKTLEELI